LDHEFQPFSVSAFQYLIFMADNIFEIEQRLTLTKSGGSAEAELKKIRDQVKGVTDESKAYNEWLKKNAAELGTESKAIAATTEALQKKTAAEKEYEKANISAAESVRDQMNPALANANEAMAGGERAAGKLASAKNQLKAAVKGLTAEYPALGAAAQFFLNPITLSIAAVTAAVATLQKKNAEAVKSFGGFQLADLTEDVVVRYERLATASGTINSNVAAISGVFAEFTANKDILDAFATGFGNKPQDSEVRAQAAREAGDRATAEAARLRAISGNFDPNNPAAGDQAKLLPGLQAGRNDLLQTLALIESVRDGSGGATGAMKYMATFGLTDPAKQASRYQSELSQTDAQIAAIMAGGQRRGERGGAFKAASEAEAAASGFYDQAARYGGEAAREQGAALKRASDGLATGAIDKLIGNIIRLADAAEKGIELTDKALQDSARVNRTANRKP